MDKRGIVNLEVKKDDRTYVFSMPIGAPLGEVYDVVLEMAAGVDEMFKEALERAKKEHEAVKARHAEYEKQIDEIDKEQKEMAEVINSKE